MATRSFSGENRALVQVGLCLQEKIKTALKQWIEEIKKTLYVFPESYDNTSGKAI